MIVDMDMGEITRLGPITRKTGIGITVDVRLVAIWIGMTTDQGVGQGARHPGATGTGIIDVATIAQGVGEMRAQDPTAITATIVHVRNTMTAYPLLGTTTVPATTAHHHHLATSMKPDQTLPDPQH